jgi:hypothetical protein
LKDGLSIVELFEFFISESCTVATWTIVPNSGNSMGGYTGNGTTM